MKAVIASMLMRLLARTWRIKVHGTIPTGACVVAFWHGEMLPIWFVFRCARPVALVSKSADGELLAQLLTDWGYHTVRGSSSTGGKEALDAMTELAANHLVLVTPDGPKGPAHIAKPGAVVAAHRAGVPLVMVRATSSRSMRFERSWDRFMLPLPFARVHVVIGAPTQIAPTSTREDIDAYITSVQDTLNTMVSV
jgi:lysophospholipid acyltransferase (LPLAT)-like uncharacterized protein